MPRSYHLQCWTRFLAPLEDVWRLKTDIDALGDELRPWFSLVPDDRSQAERALRGDGLPDTIHASMKLFGFIPTARWPLRLERLDAQRSYEDTSDNALFSAWRHRHVFEPAAGAVRYVDSVRFTPRAGLPAPLVARLTHRLFVYRHRRAALRLPAEPRTTGIAMLREL